MTAAATATATAPSHCFLLTKIPKEVRQSIYRHVFAGSKFIFTPTHRRNVKTPIRKAQSDAFVSTGQWKLLMVCHQIYDEGRAIFCEETILSTDPSEDVSANFLSESISNFTKAHVRQLRYIQPLAFQGDEICNVLSQFPKLMTCHLWLDFNKIMPDEDDTLDSQTLPAFLEERQPTALVFEAYGLLELSTRVTFLFAFRTFTHAAELSTGVTFLLAVHGFTHHRHNVPHAAKASHTMLYRFLFFKQTMLTCSP